MRQMIKYRGVLCSFVVIGVLLIFSSTVYAARVREVETFDGAVVKSHIAEHADKWSVSSTTLQAKDFDGDSGYTTYSFNDKLYDLSGKNIVIEVELEKSAWGSGIDEMGIIIASDPISLSKGTYYLVSINAHPGSQGGHNFGIHKRSPGFDNLYFNTLINSVVPGGKNKLKIVVNSTTRYHFFVNDVEINTTLIDIDPDTNISTQVLLLLPKLEGYVGTFIYDSMGARDPPFNSTTSFDNFAVEYDGVAGVGGAGAGAAISQLGIIPSFIPSFIGLVTAQGTGGGADLSQPHIPDVFLRGDVNRDGNITIDDAVATVEYVYTPKRLRNPNACVDAMDVDDNGKLNTSDIVNLLKYVFNVNDPTIPGYIIAPPNKGGSGIDLTKDTLKCPRVGNFTPQYYAPVTPIVFNLTNISSDNMTEIFLRGDPTRDGKITMEDTSFIVKYFYTPRRSRDPKACADAMDVDDNGKITIADPSLLVRYIYFKNNTILNYIIPSPNVEGPGVDPTADLLKCPRLQ